MDFAPAIVALAFVLFGLGSGRLSRSALSGTLLFAAFGLLIGPEALGLADLSGFAGQSDIVNLVLTSTLVIVLFTDACAINSAKWSDDVIPARLLGVGLPLTVIAGWATAFVVFTDLTGWEAAVLATMLAPTDAAFGKAVVSNVRVPMRIRQSLNIESGLNDGVALPLFVVFVEAGIASEESLPVSELIIELIAQVGIAVAVGAAVGVLGVLAMRWAVDRGFAERQWLEIGVVALAGVAYTLAVPLGGSGFIAAWVAGFAFGRVSARLLERAGRPVIDTGNDLHEFGEVSGEWLTMLSFLLFGIILGPTLLDLTWITVLYAVLSLTVLRMIPVALSLIGSGLTKGSLLYIGWFGPRGLATITLAIEIVDESGLEGASTIADVALFTVGLSVVAHGLTAWWGSNAYADYVERQGDDGEMQEHNEAPAVRMRRRIMR